jgi:hypothetical protein
MSISMNRIDAIINERFKPDANNIVHIEQGIYFKHEADKKVSQELKKLFPATYTNLSDRIFDELHPY